MRILSGIISTFFILGCTSQNGVFFEKLSYQQTLEKAHGLNKAVMVDVFSDGWGGCKELDRVVFQDDTAGNFINANFLSLRLNVKTDDGKNFREKFNVNGFPTVVFVSNKGEEIDRICGFSGDKENYLNIIKDYAAGKNTLGDLTERYLKDTSDVNANYLLAKKYVDRWESAKAYTYYKNILNLDPDDHFNFGEESRLQIAVFKARYQEEKDVQPLIVFLNESNNKAFLDEGYYHLRIFYRNKKDTLGYYESLEKALTFFQDNARLMNEYAWAIFKNKTEIRYQRGIELADKAVQLEPESSGIWDTLAWLYYANGEYEKAVSAMERAVAVNPDYNERMNELKKAISGQPINMDEI